MLMLCVFVCCWCDCCLLVIVGCLFKLICVCVVVGVECGVYGMFGVDCGVVTFMMWWLCVGC